MVHSILQLALIYAMKVFMPLQLKGCFSLPRYIINIQNVVHSVKLFKKNLCDVHK